MENSESETKNDSMGFKDKQRALYTLKCLTDRDISYQYRVINNYYSSAKKILKITKDDVKKFNIGEAIGIFEEWLRDYKENNRGKNNLSYLSIETIEAFQPLAENYGISDTEFYKAYKDVDGDYKALRTIKCNNAEAGVTWDIERNQRLREILKLTASPNYQWYEVLNDNFTTIYPSREHIRCILLAYSPEPSKLKSLIPKISEISRLLKVSERHTEIEKMDVTATPKQKLKRNRTKEKTSSEGSESDEPAKKTLKKEVRSEKPDEGSTFGFKDKEKALKSIESLQGRDVSYQYHVISGLIKRAERVIAGTKDKEKIEKIKAAVEVFENWITDYNVNHRSRENFAYLALDLMKAYKPLAEKYELQVHDFLSAYEQVGGDYKKLRSIKLPNENITWDIERNKNLRILVKNIKDNHKQWFETDAPLRGLPTKEHTECIMWGFSHEPAKLKKTSKLLEEKL